MRYGNFKIFKPNLKKLSGMITGYVSPNRSPDLPQKKVEGDINLGDNMVASTRIGNCRKNQEDAVLIMKHRGNEKYKMMVVADGVGGKESGEKASYICVNEIRDWFQALNEEEFINEKILIIKLSRELDSINTMIKEIGNGAATTFVCALVADKNTYIINIGDSRAYIIDGKNFEQISTDDSLAQIYFNNKAIETRDDMRFSTVSNKVTNSLGGDRLNITPNISCVPNDTYDAILLFSDGVTDCLSDDQIFAATKWTNPKKLAYKIVQKALKTTSRRPKKASDLVSFNEVIPAGKDNATAAVMINNRKKGEKRDDGR